MSVRLFLQISYIPNGSVAHDFPEIISKQSYHHIGRVVDHASGSAGPVCFFWRGFSGRIGKPGGRGGLDCGWIFPNQEFRLWLALLGRFVFSSWMFQSLTSLGSSKTAPDSFHIRSTNNRSSKIVMLARWSARLGDGSRTSVFY